jgi:hypothetical protein
LLTTTSVRVEETLGIVQGAIVQPVRQGAAIVAAIVLALFFRPPEKKEPQMAGTPAPAH